MLHNENVIQMGTTKSSDRVVTAEKGDPAIFRAGLAVRRAASGELQLNDSGSAALIGISLGPDLSDARETAVCRSGNDVPIELTDEGALASLVKGDLTFVAVPEGEAGNDISIEITDVLDTGLAPTVTVVGNKITVSIAEGEATLQQVADALSVGQAAALVTVTVAEGKGGELAEAFVEDALEGGENSFDYVEEGKPVLIDATSGKASSDGDPTGAIYTSLKKVGRHYNGENIAAAYVDMKAGL